MSHQYARRTQDEAQELARLAFRKEALANLTQEERAELGEFGLLTGGSVGPGWEPLIGFSPADRDYYEFQIYKPKDEKPYVEKSYVRILAPRNRESNTVHFMWRPSVSA